MTSSISDALEAEARALGFVAFGITPASSTPEAGARLRQWLAEGRHGDMLWMHERSAQRGSPAGLWPEVRSVMVLGLPYTPPLGPNRHLDKPGIATISVYAQGRDYHDVVKSKLKALARWFVDRTGEGVKVFVDTAPVMEKPLAEAAGLGWQGKHTNLISRKAGNWLFLGAIYTTIAFAPDKPHRDLCGSCRACQDACPTAAFPTPYRLDARRCLSYLTIEHSGPIPEEFRAALGNRIYGCDDCLAVCPWNKFADAAARHRAFLPRAELVAPRLAELLALDDAGFRRLFAGSPVKRIGRNRFVRNCAIAAGNSGDVALRAPLSALTSDVDPVVAEAARWAFTRLPAAS